jgi:hypothetical protein
MRHYGDKPEKKDKKKKDQVVFFFENTSPAAEASRALSLGRMGTVTIAGEGGAYRMAVARGQEQTVYGVVMTLENTGLIRVRGGDIRQTPSLKSPIAKLTSLERTDAFAGHDLMLVFRLGLPEDLRRVANECQRHFRSETTVMLRELLRAEVTGEAFRHLWERHCLNGELRDPFANLRRLVMQGLIWDLADECSAHAERVAA